MKAANDAYGDRLWRFLPLSVAIVWLMCLVVTLGDWQAVFHAGGLTQFFGLLCPFAAIVLCAFWPGNPMLRIAAPTRTGASPSLRRARPPVLG